MSIAVVSASATSPFKDTVPKDESSLPSDSVVPPVETTNGVAITGAVIVGAAVITGSALQSAAAIAMSVWALIAAEAPAIVVARVLAVLMLATFTLKVVFTETVSESWRTDLESRRVPRVKPVIVISESGTDRAAAKPAFLAIV
jgi:hypothetical protein